MKENLKKIIKFFKNPYVRFGYLSRLGFYNRMSDETYLKKEFKFVMGYDLNLDNPKSFNEKLQWLKLNDRKDIYTKMVDKYEAKKYVSDIIGEEYIIPTIGIYDSFKEINLNELPNKFVMKCTHDSGGLVICNDKSTLDWKAAKKKINKYLKRKYFYVHREWPYKNVKPRIIIEKYMGDNIQDYKFFCFNGIPKLMFIATDRAKHETKFNFYDMNFNLLPFSQHYPNDKRKLKKPSTFNKMIDLSKLLSKNIPHVRVDFYEINGKIYFGELTFSHFAGFIPFTPEEWDYKLGEMLDLSNIKE